MSHRRRRATVLLVGTVLGSALGASLSGAQTISRAPGTDLRLVDPTAPDGRLGGLGRRPLGGAGAVRVETRQPVPLPSPTPRVAPKTSFRAIADAIDQAADPS